MNTEEYVYVDNLRDCIEREHATATAFSDVLTALNTLIDFANEMTYAECTAIDNVRNIVSKYGKEHSENLRVLTKALERYI